MIPKIIHYCWFGGKPKPKLVERCIASWKHYCPDYQIIEWNETNFDIDNCDYTKFCYENKRFAYLSDYVRLWAVLQKGGIYFDTDVELIKTPDDLLKNGAFFGFEGTEFINTGIGFGALAGHWAVTEMLNLYRKKTVEELQQSLDVYNCLTGSPKINTYAMTPHGLVQNGEKQQIGDTVFLPQDYLCPFDDQTGELHRTENTISIHWYGKSANTKYAAMRSRLLRPIKRLIKRVRRKVDEYTGAN